jgi:MFS family permease
MTFLKNRRFHAAVLSAALLLPAATAFGSDWTKPMSRTRGSAIGATAGAVLGGPVGAVAGGAVGNGVQSLRHHMTQRTTHTAHHRHHRRY